MSNEQQTTSNLQPVSCRVWFLKLYPRLIIQSCWRLWCLIAAFISDGYYSAPIFFYYSKNLNCIGALSFLRLEEEYWRSPFFNQFYWSDFWSGKWNACKSLEWFWCWTKVNSGAKREWFCSYRCFWESEKLMCEKIFSKRAKFFFCSHAAFKSSFFATFGGYEIWLWY